MLQASCAQPEAAILHLDGGLKFLQKNSKILFCISLRRNQDPAPRLHYCLTGPPLFLHPLPSLTKQLFESALWNSGKVKEAE